MPTTTAPTPELDARFSSGDATPRPWAEVQKVLDDSELFFLSTVRRDGRPHVTPLPAIWHDGALHFCTGPTEQKSRNLEGNQACTLTTGSSDMKSGLDVVVEGRAVRVTDQGQLTVLADLWREQLEWPFEAVDGGFREVTPEVERGETEAGVANVYRLEPAKVLAFGKGEPYSQTRYRFP